MEEPFWQNTQKEPSEGCMIQDSKRRSEAAGVIDDAPYARKTSSVGRSGSDETRRDLRNNMKESRQDRMAEGKAVKGTYT